MSIFANKNEYLALDSLYKGFKNDIDKVKDTMEEIEREVESGSKW